MGNLFSNTMRNRAIENCFPRKVLHSSHDVELVAVTDLDLDGALPADLMLEILQRLPSKSLMRFLSVSKAWHSVILSPTFTEKRQIYHHQYKVIGFIHRYNNIEKGVRLISRKTDDVTETNTDVPLPFTVETLSSHFDSKVYFVGCSNGLVCIRLCKTKTFFCCSSERSRFGLWNPATRQFKLLPSPKIIMYWLPDDHELFGSIDGFSYVPRIRDYKVVRILVFKDKRSANVRYLGRALLLDVATKTWRELESLELPCTGFDPRVVVANGRLHLLVFRPEGGPISYNHTSVLSFDFDEERFRHTSAPYLCNHLNCSLKKCWRMLTLYNENLAMFVSPKFRADEQNSFELWVCNGLTWSKKFSFGRLRRSSFPFGFWSNGQIVVRKNYSYNQPSSSAVEAYMYNPFNKEKSPIPCDERNECSLIFHSYIESLVQI